jgi:hypothetical protein
MAVQSSLQFPEKLIVRLVEDDTGRPVPNIATTLTLYAKRKNNYNFGPGLSDSVGTITISRDWVERSIKETIGFFVMDYASTIDHCYPFIDLEVKSIDDIQRAIAARRLYSTVKEGELGVVNSISDLENASNHAYEPQTVRIKLDTPGEAIREVLIKLRRRSPRA